MALLKCIECGASISDKSEKCIHCGAPVLKSAENTNVSPRRKKRILIITAIIVVVVILLAAFAGYMLTRKIKLSNEEIYAYNAVQSLMNQSGTLKGFEIKEIRVTNSKDFADSMKTGWFDFTVRIVYQAADPKIGINMDANETCAFVLIKADGTVDQSTYDLSQGLSNLYFGTKMIDNLDVSIDVNIIKNALANPQKYDFAIEAIIPTSAVTTEAPIPTSNNTVTSSAGGEKELIYEQYTKEGADFSYHVPAINIDSVDVENINEKISEFCEDNIDACTKIGYSSYTYKDTLSLVIAKSYPDDVNVHKVYNINISAGEPVNNSDLLSMLGISQDTFLNVAKICAAEQFKANFDDFKIMVQEAQTQYNNTIASENINLNIPMFLDNEGKLNIIATIFSMAGADGYAEIINTNLSEDAPTASSNSSASDPLYRQVVEVLTTGSSASITLYEWDKGDWTKKFSCLGYVGKNGITETKTEGDGKTPRGKFTLGFVFGLTQPETGLPYKNVVPGTVWVDDVNSEYYNTWQMNDASYKDWNSAEDLYKDCNTAITEAISFNYNGDGQGIGGFMDRAVQGGGSALWFTGRNTVRKGTPGDIDISQADMTSILKLLDIQAVPIIDIKPATSGSEYND